MKRKTIRVFQLGIGKTQGEVHLRGSIKREIVPWGAQYVPIGVPTELEDGQWWVINLYEGDRRKPKKPVAVMRDHLDELTITLRGETELPGDIGCPHCGATQGKQSSK